jgi:hypothetical protein
MNSPIPTPARLADTPRHDLLNGLTAHEAVLVDARHGIGAPRTADDLRAAALGACAYGRALAESATRWEWIAQVEALAHGAPLDDVATATGLTAEEVVIGLRSRIAGQVQHAGMTRSTASDLMDLIERAAATTRGGVGLWDRLTIRGTD